MDDLDDPLVWLIDKTFRLPSVIAWPVFLCWAFVLDCVAVCLLPLAIIVAIAVYYWEKRKRDTVDPYGA